MKRREFLGGAAALAGIRALAAPEEKTTDGGFAPVSWAERTVQDVPRLPTGARSVERFLAKCVGCGLCAAACPSKCLRPSENPKRLGRVELDFRHGWCRPACHACADVCPADAIAPVDLDRRRDVHIGFASVRKDLCLRTAEGVECHACEKHCPVRAVKILSGVPVVNRDACVGCGACEHYCPVRPQTAIAVTAYRVHRAITPIAEADLVAEMRARLGAGAACVAASGGVIFAVREGRGVEPALELLDAERPRLGGALVADRVVGRAAAAIWIQAGVRKVVASVMSEGAVRLLEAHGVAHAAERIVPEIRNRESTGTCPMDARIEKLTDPAEIVRTLRLATGRVGAVRPACRRRGLRGSVRFAALAVLLSALSAAPAASVSFDRAAHSVTLTATATGVGDAEPLEFLFVSPESDRAYEALYVTEAGAAEIARAFEAAGIPRGRPVNAAACRFRPTGPRLTIEPPIDSLLKEKDAARLALPLVWTGGTRGADGIPEAATNMPGSIASLFDCGQSLLTLDDALPQSDVYGRYTARTKLAKGAKATFTIRWDGASTCAVRRVTFRSGGLKAALESLKGSALPIDLEPDFDGALTVVEAQAVASALAVVDSRAVRVNGFRDGQFFYGAYRPLEKWRDRHERLSQPLEVRLAADGTASYTVVDEDWNVEGNDPKLSARSVSAPAFGSFKGDTCFFFVPPGTRLDVLYRMKPALPKSIRNWYVYADGR